MYSENAKFSIIDTNKGLILLSFTTNEKIKSLAVPLCGEPLSETVFDAVYEKA